MVIAWPAVRPVVLIWAVIPCFVRTTFEVPTGIGGVGPSSYVQKTGASDLADPSAIAVGETTRQATERTVSNLRIIFIVTLLEFDKQNHDRTGNVTE